MNKEQIILNATVQQWEGLKHRLIMMFRSRRDLHNTSPDCDSWEAKHETAKMWGGKFYQYKKELIEVLRDGQD